MIEREAYAKEFARRVRLMRESFGWSREDLSEKSGFPASSIADWEEMGSVPTLENALAIADAFACPMDDLVGRSLLDIPGSSD